MVLTKNEIIARLNVTPPLLDGLRDIDLQIQPNGVDLRVAKLFRFRDMGKLGFDNCDRRLSSLDEIKSDKNRVFNLDPAPYLVQFCEFMNLPTDLMAIGRPRSSLLRMGVTIDSAVWDAGFRGYSQSLLLVQAPLGLLLEEEARIMQVVFFKLSSSTEAYDGEFKVGDISARG